MITKQKSQYNRAFTIMEMLVVIAIFGILTAVVMFQYGKFNSHTIMVNTAYEVATTIQQAQVFSLGHKSQIGSDNLKNRYGAYFDLSKSLKEFIFFIDYGVDEDDPANGICEGVDGSGSCFSCVPGDECIEKFRLTRDIFFDQICVSLNNDPIDGNEQCVTSLDAATVTFQRPNPDAIVVNPENEDAFNSIGIILSNSFNNRMAVIVRSTGQISVERLSDK